MPGNRASATIRDIARLAGVGTTSVSKYFSGKGYLGAGTRGEIERAVGKTDYRINSSARALKSRSVRELAIVTAGGEQYKSYLRDSFMAHKFAAVTEAAFRRGYDLILVHAPADPPSRFDAAVRTHSFSGVLFLDPPPPHFTATLARFSIPHVFSNFSSVKPGAPALVPGAPNAVVSDFARMFDDILGYASRRGYRQIAFQGFAGRVARAAGVIARHAARHRLDNTSAELAAYCSGRSDAATLRACAQRKPTLFVVEQRCHATRLFVDFFSRGKPEYAGLLAMDDFPEYAALSPAVSHIAQNIDAISEGCVEMLVRMAEHHQMRSAGLLVPTSIVEKATT